MSPCTEDKLLSESAAYLAKLEDEGRLGQDRPRVCHHFFPLDGTEADIYLPELPKLISQIDPEGLVDLIGDPVGIEVWNLREPTNAWITPRVRAFHAAAVACSAVYAGWTYEPDRRPTNGN